MIELKAEQIEALLLDGLPVITVPTGARPHLGGLDYVDLGAALKHALAGRTARIHMLVAYFSHSEVRDTSGRDTPDAIVLGELAEAASAEYHDDAAESSLSLAFGELTSVEACMAFWAWYWACRWHAADTVNAEAAARWRTNLLKALQSDENVAAQAIARLLADDDFDAWFQKVPDSEQDSWVDIAGLVNSADVRAAGSTVGTGAAARLFTFLCARKADVRWGGMGRGREQKGTFHPKLYVIERENQAGTADSVVLVGSGNWSKSALSAQGKHGNVEMGMGFRIAGHVWGECAPDSASPASRVTWAGKRIFQEFCTQISAWKPTTDRPVIGVFADVKQALVRPLAPPSHAEQDAQFPPLLQPYVDALRFARDVLSDQLGYARLRGLPAGVLQGTGQYQEDGARRLVAIIERDWGALLCDSTGLGKTWVAMRVIAHYARVFRDLRVVVIVPNATKSQWEEELNQQRRLGCNVDVLVHGMFQSTNISDDYRKIVAAELVVIDESHNFRNGTSTRSNRLRALLSLPTTNMDGTANARAAQGEYRPRRTLLMTATPINNSIDDLVAQVALFRFPVDGRKTPESLDRSVWTPLTNKEKIDEWLVRLRIATRRSGEWPAATRIDNAGWDDWAKNGVADYVKKQQQQLDLFDQQRRNGGSPVSGSPQQDRVMDNLLNQIMVRRNRKQAKHVDKRNGVDEMLFRPQPEKPAVLQVIQSDQERAVLATLLQAFDEESQGVKLMFAVYQAYAANSPELGALGGLQKMLFLKRLESSSVLLLQSMLRLIGLHAYRIVQTKSLVVLASQVAELEDTVLRSAAWPSIAQLWGCAGAIDGEGQLRQLAKHYGESSLAKADEATIDEDPMQTDCLPDAELNTDTQLVNFGHIVSDFRILVESAGQLAPLVLGEQLAAWPTKLALPGEVAWPKSAVWAQRLHTDGKVYALFALLAGHVAAGRKVIVFSQFSDSLAYIRSVVEAALENLNEIPSVVAHLGTNPTALQRLLSRVAYISGATDDVDKDRILQAFSPYYHKKLTPFPTLDRNGVEDRAGWTARWKAAAQRPVDILFATDVMAEGVNLQDAAVLVNFDLHWNPVRLIQRAGRIDRRLSRATETGNEFAQLLEIEKAEQISDVTFTIPSYYFQGRDEAPQFVNAILPPEIEQQLRLCQRLARKAITIRASVGLDRDIGIAGVEMDNEMDERMRADAFTEESNPTKTGNAELANIALINADYQIGRQERRGATGLESPQFVFRLHPKAGKMDPFLVRVRYTRNNQTVLRTGLIFPAGWNEAFDLPLGVARTTDGRTHLVDIDNKKKFVLGLAPEWADRCFFSKINTPDLARIVGELAPAAVVFKMRDTQWSGNAAYRLIWSVLHAEASDSKEVITANPVGDSPKIVSFTALQFPARFLNRTSSPAG